jgi:cob(I)alamin adenosyltransferase
MAKIYTKRGDKGKTDLLKGGRVGKDSARVEAYGTVDELNSVLGAAETFCAAAEIKETIVRIQRDLFSLGSVLAQKEKTDFSEQLLEGLETRVVEMEQQIDTFDKELPRLMNFILPGGTKGAGLIHQARSVCRRAERRVVAVSRRGVIDPVVYRYLNRLSDLLFTLARVENYRTGRGDRIVHDIGGEP